MRRSPSILLVLTSVVLAANIQPLSAAPEPERDGFVLRDLLGRNWSNELVTFSLSKAQLKHARANHALVGPDGQPALYQFVAEPKPVIQFLANLNAFETREYYFDKSAKRAVTDLEVEKKSGEIRITNHRIGLAVPQKLKDGAGPLAGIRLGSEKWIGASTIAGDLSVTSYTAEVTSQGPAYAEITCRVAFSNQSTWNLTFRLDANEPVILVTETAEVESPATSFIVTLNREFAADSLFYRRGFQDGDGVTGKIETWKLATNASGVIFVLEPWLHWQTRVRQGNWFALFGKQEPDMLTVGALNPDRWADLQRAQGTQVPPQLLLTREGSDLRLTFPLKHGFRRWLIAAPDKTASLALLRETDLQRAPLPQQSVIKHGNFPLDLVKDYIFEWEAKPDRHPGLLLTESDVARLRSAVSNTNAMAVSIRNILRGPALNAYFVEEPIRLYLASGDPDLGRFLATHALIWMQNAADMYLKQDSLVTLGFAPHHQQGIIVTLALADAALAGNNFVSNEAARLRAQAAFLGYTLARPDYWSPERGFCANPNMTTSVRGYQVAVASFVASHPMAKTWADQGLTALRDQIDNWSDANGGWLEAPHYAMVSYDQILGAFLMARNAGFSDDVYRPKMRKVMEWFGKISTPPDSRIGGYRHLPPLGNTYLMEPTGEYGIAAYVWRQRDPAFAAELQWMFKQNNCYPQPGIGGSYPGLWGYRGMMVDTNLEAKPPAWGSELFPETGVVLRNRYPSERETYLHMILGSNHDHYDRDSGSITFWGKGRVLADDFGYYGCAPAEDHNLLLSPTISYFGTMHVENFQTSSPADYVRGKNGAWTREALLIKDADPLAPNYAVLADSLGAPAPVTWQLWCMSTQVMTNASGAFVNGKEDVDMDIFFAAPTAFRLKTETKTRRSGSGLYTNWTWSGMDSTQMGLLASTNSGSNFLAVLYPRLKTETAPTFRTVADGKGVQIRHATGTDYVFAGRTPFTYKDESVDFEGTVGVAQLRNQKPALFLGAAGRLTAGGETVTSNMTAVAGTEPPEKH